MTKKKDSLPRSKTSSRAKVSSMERPTGKRKSTNGINKTESQSKSIDIKERRKLRKRQDQIEHEKQRDKNGNIVYGEGEESFWEVEKVVGRRMIKKKVQYLVRWKGFSEAENTWEPAEHLCDTAMAEAKRYTTMMKKRIKELEESEELLLAPDQGGAIHTVTSSDIVPDEVPSGDAIHNPAAGLEDGRWAWTDEEQINYQQVERIKVSDLDAKERVTIARVNGTPVVLIGHVGWANFAKDWLEPTSSDQVHDSETWIDLSKPHFLNIEKMILSIGNEEVPVVRRNYNETNPIHGNILASKFLSTCWPNANDVKSIPPTGSGPNLYLHQWQFPLSDTAGGKLCHQSNRLPNDILGEDLLKYWIDLPQCKGDSPLQYLFMGREETMSKLHRDNGGLAILIAPIVGEKECVLVHRSDGASCLYHLDAKLDDIDLHAYPLMAHARIWKTTIQPGEILLMPHGTYHQCRNVSPCLSYSRFHLDAVNLLAFFQSMIDGDAPEILHKDVLWNSTTELIRKIDRYFDLIRARRKSNSFYTLPPLNNDMVKTVDTLRALRHICRELHRRENVQNTVKGKRVPGISVRASKASDRKTVCPVVGAASPANLEASRPDHDWSIIVDDIDICLHEFRHRNMDRIPPFRPRREKKSKDKAALMDQAIIDESQAYPDGSIAPVTIFATDVESAFLDLPYASIRTLEDKKPIAFQEGNHVIVHLHGRRAEGVIMEICSPMDAAYLSYEDYPAFYDEYQPYEKLRSPIGGDRAAEMPPDEVQPGIVVMNRWGDLGEEYRAVVRHTSTETFLKVRLNLGSCHILRWVPVMSIVKKL